MVRTLWGMPVAPTALFTDARFAQLPGRQCQLSFDYESESDDNMVSDSLVFEGVEYFKCTYLTSCTAEMFEI